MGRKYMGSGFGGRKSLIRMIADKLNEKANELERQTLQAKNEQQREHNIRVEPGYAKRGQNYASIKPKKTFLEYALTEGDVIIVLDVEDIIREYELDRGLITNNVFDNIRCDKVDIIWSPKKELYYYVALNDDYTCFILWKNGDVYQLPYIDRIDLDNLPINAQIIENINRLIISV